MEWQDCWLKSMSLPFLVSKVHPVNNPRPIRPKVNLHWKEEHDSSLGLECCLSTAGFEIVTWIFSTGVNLDALKNWPPLMQPDVQRFWVIYSCPESSWSAPGENTIGNNHCHSAFRGSHRIVGADSCAVWLAPLKLPKLSGCLRRGILGAMKSGGLG